jgi:hypothetical protein
MEIRVDDRGRQTRVEVPRASEVKPTTRADTRMAEIYRDMKRDEGETLRALSSASPPLEYAHVDDPRGGGLVTNLDATLNLTTSINGLKDTLNRLLRGK